MSNGNHSVDELLAWLDGKSRTHGWGAIVAYDRRKTNNLLDQLYIERFTSGSYLPLISETIDSSEYSKEHVTGLKLSVPKLSFANADLEDSRAALSMDFVGGMIMTELSASGAISRIDRILKVLPVGGPKLSMALNLKRTPGTVGDAGVVALDISEGEDFKADFVLGDLSQEQVGARFKVLFNALDAEQKVFPLGTLAGDLNGPLTPESFEIRTMPAPGAKQVSAANHGDGAVLLFVRLKGGSSGSYPGSGSGFKYLIPADKNGVEYTGTALVASKLLMKDLVMPHIEKELGRGLKLTPTNDSSDLAVSLQASTGSWKLDDIDLTEGSGGSAHRTHNIDPLTFDFASNEPFTITPTTGRQLKFTWKQIKTFLFYYYRKEWDISPNEEEADTQFTHATTFYLKPSVDPVTGHVNFEPAPGMASSVSVKKTSGDVPIYYSFLRHFEAHVERLIAAMHTQLSRMALPTVDTFLIRNLLFPGHNALQLHDAHVPGDLALFGHIDPLRTNATIAPQQPILGAGVTQQFTLSPSLAGVAWSVSGTDPADTDVGTVNASGLYKAPAPSPGVTRPWW